MSYMVKLQERTCLECGCNIHGRNDKKFCGAKCKNIYNNKLGQASRNFKLNVISKISKNYSILEMLVKDSVTSIDLAEIEQLGFDDNYITSFKMLGRQKLFYCFDICYRKSCRKIIGLRRSSNIFSADPFPDPNTSQLL